MSGKTPHILGAIALVLPCVAADTTELNRMPGSADARDRAIGSTWSICSTECDFSSVQAAIDAAAAGDTLLLGPETFYENVVIEKDLVLQGAGRGRTILDGSRRTTVVKILGTSESTQASTVTLADMTIRLGQEEYMSENFGTGGGVAVGRDSRLSVERCEITQNDADEQGGGIMAFHADVVVVDSLLHLNGSFSRGGGIFVKGGSLSVRGTTLDRNYGAFGGGIYVSPDDSGTDVEIVNSTITRNLEGFLGGGVVCESAEGQWLIQDSTITGNSGAGLMGDAGIESCRAEMIVMNTLISDNTSGDCLDLFSAISGGHNLIADFSCSFAGPDDIEGVAPLLGPLDDYGGPTPTHALAAESPAIDAGGHDCSTTDQRGVDRPQDGDGDGVAYCDIGAFEYEAPPTTIAIDVKPGGDSNSINPGSHGVIPVAVLGSPDFAVADIDVETLRFGPDGAGIAHRHGHFDDVNADGIVDLVTHYPTEGTGIACGDTSATLTGNTWDGIDLEGSDTIRTVGCASSNATDSAPESQGARRPPRLVGLTDLDG